MFREYWNRLRLNLRAARLAVLGVWMNNADVADSYDALADTYDERWAVHLRATTNRLHEHLPATLAAGKLIIELGCGSGNSTLVLREKYPESPIVAVDISPGMIDRAKAKLTDAQFQIGDMLAFLKAQERGGVSPPVGTSLIFSAWAIGYSQPSAIITEAARILLPGGSLALVVNRFDTMPVVFETFRQAMRRYPDALNKALLPRFPKGASVLTTALKRSGFRINFLDEGAVPIAPPPKNRLDWLLGTGILAGFDAVLPLRSPGQVRDFFAEVLDKITTGWEHRYVMLVGVKDEHSHSQC